MTQDWLADFVEYGTYGEASPRLMYWVGVSTIAAALRRKVWLDFKIYQWSPNFYILIVGSQGLVRKSTSIDIGLNLLKHIEGIHIGPSSITWQALIQYIAEHKDTWPLPEGGLFEMSPVTLALSEFGTFFDPENRELADQMTDLWDGKIGVIEKATKTSGVDTMVNPWINLVAGTTPAWLAANFGSHLVGGGLAGRFIYLYGEMPTKDSAYPDDDMPLGWHETQRSLVERLRDMSKLAGPYTLTREAREWGKEWYEEQRATLRLQGVDSLEAGFESRKQVHLHKLAMVVSAARGKFPLVDVECMQEAMRQLDNLAGDTRRVFGYVGQNRVSSAAREIVEYVTKMKMVERRKLYQQHFYRTMGYGEFEEALRSAVQAELVLEVGDVAKPMLMPRKEP